MFYRLFAVTYLIISTFTPLYSQTDDYFKKADEFAQQKNYEEAFKNYELALKQNDKDSIIYFHYGWYLFLDNKIDQAIEVTLKGYAIDSTNRFIVGNLALYYFAKGEIDKGKDYYNSLFRLKLSRWEYFQVLKEDLTETQDNLFVKKEYKAEAQNYFKEKMLSIDPDYEKDIPAYQIFFEAQAKYNSGNMNEAIEYLKKSIEKGSDRIKLDAFSSIGLCYYNIKDYPNALMFYKKAFEMDVKNLAIAEFLASFLFDTISDKEEGIKYALKAESLGSKEGNLYLNLALYYAFNSKAAESITYLDKALQHITIDCGYLDSKNEFQNISNSVEFKNLRNNCSKISKADSLLSEGKRLYDKKHYDEALKSFLNTADIYCMLFGKENLNAANCYNLIGNLYHTQKDYDNAIKYFDTAIKIQFKIYGENVLDIATNYGNIGCAYSEKKEYDQAIRYYEKTLTIQLAKLGENHTDTASTYNSIGEVYLHKGEYNKGLEYFEKALRIQLKLLGENNVATAYTYSLIGAVLLKKYEYDKSIEYCEKAIKIREFLQGENHLDTAYCYNYIGSVYMEKGEYKKAIRYYEKNLSIQLGNFGANHLSVAESYNNIGSAYYKSREYDKAIGYFDKELAIQLKNLGTDHLDIAVSYTWLSSSYYYKGDYDKAIYYYDKAISIQLTKLGENHLSISESYNNIGVIYRSKGDYSKSIYYYEKALNIQIVKLGKDHLETANSYNNLGIVYYYENKYDMAIYHFEKALSIRLEKLGKDNDYIIRSYNNLGYTYYSKGDYDKAIEYYKKALSIELGKSGCDPQNIALTYDWISSAYLEKEDYDKVIEFSNRALEINIKLLGENHNNIAESYLQLGISYREKGDYNKAIVYFEKMSKVRLMIFGKNHPKFARTCISIGKLYDAKGDYDKSNMYFEQALKIYLTYYIETDEDFEIHKIRNPFKIEDEINFLLRMNIKDKRSLAIGYYLSSMLNYEKKECFASIDFAQKALLQMNPQKDTVLMTLTYWTKALSEIDLGKNSDALDSIINAEKQCEILSKRGKQNYEEPFEIKTSYIKAKVLKALGQTKDSICLYENILKESISKQKDADQILKSKLEKLESYIRSDLGELYKKESTDNYIRSIDIHRKYSPENRLDIESMEASYMAVIRDYITEGKYDDAQKLMEELNLKKMKYSKRDIFKFSDKNKQVIVNDYNSKNQEIESLEWKLKQEKYNKNDTIKDKKKNDEKNNLEEEVRIKKRELQIYLTKLKISDPHMSSLLNAEPIVLNKIQEKLPENVAILQYLVMNNKTIIFVITNKGIIDIIEVDVKKEILKKYSKDFINSSRGYPMSVFSEHSKKLYRLLLEPIQKKGYFKGIKSLGIAPNNFLHNIPFAALIDEDDKYISDNYDLFFINSMSILSVALDSKSYNGKTDASLFAFGNPDGSLPEARKEVEEIGKIFSDNKKKIIILTDDKAIKDALVVDTKSEIIHLATHGYLNGKDITKSYLRMSRSDNIKEQLTIEEIWGLPFNNVRLAVLSACETGLGENLSGDDVISIENAFIYAGCPTVIASLWSVDDKATKELMVLFYKNLGKGLTPSTSMSLAQKVLRSNDSFKHPKYWAAFTVRGSWE